MIAKILTYFFSSITLLSSILVVFSQNTIHSILFLILTFVSAAGIMILLKCEFVAFVFLMLYVGAISVLLLFVVMMINSNVKIKYNNKNFSAYFPFGCFLIIIFLVEFYLIILKIFNSNLYENCFLFNYHINWYNSIDSLSDISTIGQVLYTYYFLQFLLMGLLLLMGIIGAVVLTVSTEVKRRKQSSFKQLSRNYKNIFTKKMSKFN